MSRSDTSAATPNCARSQAATSSSQGRSVAQWATSSSAGPPRGEMLARRVVPQVGAEVGVGTGRGGVGQERVARAAADRERTDRRGPGHRRRAPRRRWRGRRSRREARSSSARRQRLGQLADPARAAAVAGGRALGGHQRAQRRSGRAGRPARRRRRGWRRRRWCARRRARRRPGSAGARCAPLKVSGATDDTGLSSSGWWATIRSAPTSSASSTVSGTQSTTQRTRRDRVLEVAEHQTDPVPRLRPGRRVTARRGHPPRHGRCGARRCRSRPPTLSPLGDGAPARLGCSRGDRVC